MMMRGRVKYSGLIMLVFLSLTLFSGCRVFKKVVKSGGPVSEDENLVRKVVANQPDWKFIELRMTGRAEEDDSKFSFMGTVKIERNKQIFIMLRSTLGFEIARVYANRDSIWVLSKMLNIKEKGDWKFVVGKIGYPIDFNAFQGIMVQALFTSVGDQINELIANLAVKNEKENMHLVSNPAINHEERGIKYLNDFLINKENFFIDGSKIRDVKGQWIADVRYTYNKENVIKKIDLKGIDSERNFSFEVNVVKKEIKDFIEINFDKF